MTEFERIEKRFKQLRDFLTERQAEDPDADRHDEGDGYNIARVDLHEIKLAFFALAQERDRLRAENDKLRVERDEARRAVCRLHEGWGKWTAKDLAEVRGWDCFKEATGCSNG
jgi:hypothetical protein